MTYEIKKTPLFFKKLSEIGLQADLKKIIIGYDTIIYSGDAVAASLQRAAKNRYHVLITAQNNSVRTDEKDYENIEIALKRFAQAVVLDKSGKIKREIYK